MTTCPTCGNVARQGGAGWTILKWCIGLAVVAVIGLPVMIVVLLAVVAAIGSQASDEFEQQLAAQPAARVSQPFDEFGTSDRDLPMPPVAE